MFGFNVHKSGVCLCEDRSDNLVETTLLFYMCLFSPVERVWPENISVIFDAISKRFQCLPSLISLFVTTRQYISTGLYSYTTIISLWILSINGNNTTTTANNTGNNNNADQMRIIIIILTFTAIDLIIWTPILAIKTQTSLSLQELVERNAVRDTSKAFVELYSRKCRFIDLLWKFN